MTDSPEVAVTEPDEQTPLLLHSLAHLRELWLPVLEAADVHSVTEIGSETGVTTTLVADWLSERGGSLVTIDPQPAAALVELEAAGRVELVRELSPAALEGRAVTDAYLVDGDHNYSVVSRELATIAAALEDEQQFPLLVFHDVGWPSGRRDQYYDPSALPPEDVKQHTWDRGVRPGHPGVAAGGFRGEGEFAWAVEEGGPRNGVRTAIEDFLATRDDLEFVVIPSVFGLGVVYPREASYASEVAALLAAFDRHPLLERLERNRVDLFVRVIDLQDEVARLTAQVAEQRGVADRLQALAAARAARAEGRELALREELLRLEAELAEARAAAAAADSAAHAGTPSAAARLRGQVRRVADRLGAP